MSDIKYKQSKEVLEDLKEHGLYNRAKKMEKFWDGIHRSHEKKTGDIVVYDRLPEIKTTYLDELDEFGHIQGIHQVLCDLPRGTKLTILEDCNDGQFGIYITDKGTFFARNLDVVREDHSLYKDAQSRGYIK